MLYRVHLPYKDNGSFGSHLGYVQLCIGHINSYHVIRSLFESGLVPKNWFIAKDIRLTAVHSTVYSHNAYIMTRVITGNHLFLLYPLDYSDSKAAAHKSGLSPVNYITLTGPTNWTIQQPVVQWNDIPNGNNQ